VDRDHSDRDNPGEKQKTAFHAPPPSPKWTVTVVDLAGCLPWLRRTVIEHEARVQRGLLAQALIQTKLAVDDFRRILAVEPDWDRVRYRRVLALIRLGRHCEALADLDILSCAPSARPVFNPLALAY
jgi:hypothetical protein